MSDTGLLNLKLFLGKRLFGIVLLHLRLGRQSAIGWSDDVRCYALFP